MSGLLLPDKPRKRRSTTLQESNSHKRIETSYQLAKGSGTKTEIGKNLLAEIVTRTAENKGELEIEDGEEDGEEDDAPPSLEEMIAKLKLNKQPREGDVKKEIRRRRRRESLSGPGGVGLGLGQSQGNEKEVS